MSSLMLHLQATQTARENNITCFSASWSWRKHFIKRHGLSIRTSTRHGQITPEDAKIVAVKFGNDVKNKMKELGILTVHNADQTGKLVMES